MYMSKIICVVIILILSIQYVESKTIRDNITLNKFKKEGGFHYLTKMSLDIGSGSWTVKARFNKRVNMPDGQSGDALLTELLIFLDDEWQYMDQSRTCQDKKSLQAARRNQEYISIPTDNSWSNQKSGNLTQSQRRRTWFFVISDCSMDRIQALIDANRHMGIRIEVEFNITNNGSQFSSDEAGFIGPITFLLLVTAAGFAYGIQHFIKNYKKGDGFDWGLFLILLALGFQGVFLFFELIHQWSYSSNGRGLFVLELFGELCEVLSQFILSCFLLLVSWGWTINYMELDSFDIIIPLGVLMGVIHMMIMGLGKLTDNSHDKFHQYDGWSGYLIFFIRICIFIYFLFGIKDTIQKASNKLKQFVQQLTFFGGLYILAFPILLIISWFVADYVKNIVITIGTLCIQTLALLVMVYLNTSTKSAYYQVSMKSQTILPSKL